MLCRCDYSARRCVGARLFAAVLAVDEGKIGAAGQHTVAQKERKNAMKTWKFLMFAAVLGALFAAGCAKQPGPKLRETERVSEMSDAEIDAAREACHLISTRDYNCAELVEPTHGMSPDEWRVLSEATKECRKNQLLSFHHCLRGKGVRYSEYH